MIALLRQAEHRKAAPYIARMVEEQFAGLPIPDDEQMQKLIEMAADRYFAFGENDPQSVAEHDALYVMVEAIIDRSGASDYEPNEPPEPDVDLHQEQNDFAHDDDFEPTEDG